MRSNRHIRRLGKRIDQLKKQCVSDPIVELVEGRMTETLEHNVVGNLPCDIVPMTRYWRSLRQSVSDEALGLQKVQA